MCEESECVLNGLLLGRSTVGKVWQYLDATSLQERQDHFVLGKAYGATTKPKSRNLNCLLLEASVS